MSRKHRRNMTTYTTKANSAISSAPRVTGYKGAITAVQQLLKVFSDTLGNPDSSILAPWWASTKYIRHGVNQHVLRADYVESYFEKYISVSAFLVLLNVCSEVFVSSTTYSDYHIVSVAKDGRKRFEFTVEEYHETL